MADYSGLDPSVVDFLGGGAPASMPNAGGLDPSVISFIQGGAPPPQQQLSAAPEPPTDAPPSFSLHPAVAAAVQGGFAPAPDAQNGINGSPPVLPPPPDATPNLSLPPPPAPRPYAGADLSTPLSPAVTAAVQNGFAPQSPSKLPADVYGSPNAKKGALPNPEDAARQADALQYGAVNQLDQSDRAQTQAQEQLNAANARIQNEYNARSAEQAKRDQANEAQYQKDRQALMAQRTQQVQDWAKYKVNTDRSVGIGGLIAIALSGIGQALDHQHGPNTALQILDAANDKRIADQWAQKNELGKVVDTTDSQLSAIGATARDRREAEGLQRATLLQQQENALKSAALQYADPQMKAKALAMAADRQNQRAQIISGIAGRQAQENREQREAQQQGFTNRLQAGHLALANKQFQFEQDKDKRDFGERQREYDDSLAEKILTAKNAGKTAEVAQLESVRKYGLRDPSTGDLILDQKGEAMRQQADQLEVAARNKTGADAAADIQKAADLRKQADLENHISHEKAPEIQTELNSAQNVVDTVASIKAQLAKDPGMTDRATWAALAGQYANAKGNAIKFFGGKTSSREMEAFEEFMGSDGSKLFDRSFSKDKMASQLDQLAKSITADSDSTLRGAGYKGQFHIQAHQGEALAPIAGKTDVEQGADARRGAIGQYLPDSDLKFRDNKTRELQAENSADTGPTGLPKADTARVQQLVSSYDKATDVQRAKALTELTAYANSPREAVSTGVATLLRSNPQMYQQVLSTLPPERQAQWRMFDQNVPQLQSPGVTITTKDGRTIVVPRSMVGK